LSKRTQINQTSYGQWTGINVCFELKITNLKNREIRIGTFSFSSDAILREGRDSPRRIIIANCCAIIVRLRSIQEIFFVKLGRTNFPKEIHIILLMCDPVQVLGTEAIDVTEVFIRLQRRQVLYNAAILIFITVLLIFVVRGEN